MEEAVSDFLWQAEKQTAPISNRTGNDRTNRLGDEGMVFVFLKW
jgi:hypothetical protein